MKQACLPSASSPGCLPSSAHTSCVLPYPPGRPAEGPGTPVSARPEQPASGDSGPTSSAPHDTPPEPREAAAIVCGLDEHRGPREPAGAPASKTRWVPLLLPRHAVALPCPARPSEAKEAVNSTRVQDSWGVSVEFRILLYASFHI